MKDKKGTFPLVWALLAACLLWTSSAAAEVNVSLRAPSNKVILGDELVVQVKVENADNAAELDLPQVEGLSIRQLGPPSSSSQTVVVNGQMNQYQGLTFSVGITADRIGHFEVPPFKVVHQGQTYATAPLELEAVKGRDLGAIDLELSAAKKRLYLGEPLVLTLTWRLYEPIEDYGLKFPLLYDKDQLKLRLVPIESGQPTEELRIDKFRVAFRSKDLGQEGKEYQTSFKLYPQEPGRFKVPAAHAKAMVPRGTAYVRDFFGRLRERAQTEAAYASAGPLDVEVLPLPQKGRPPGFKGAVGRFRIEADTEHRSYQMGEPIDLRLRIWGEGDLSRVDRPQLKGYEKDFKFRENLAPGELSDESLIFTQRLQPKAPGEATLPPVRLSFFNPRTGAYETVQTEPIQLKILPAEELGAQDLFGPSARRSHGSGNGTRELLSQQTEDSWPWWVWLLGLPLPLLAPGLARFKKTPPNPDAPELEPAVLERLERLHPGEFEAEAARLLDLWLAGQLGAKRRWGPEEWKQLEARVGPDTAQAARSLDADLEAARYGGGQELDRSSIRQRLAKLATAPKVGPTQAA